VTSRPEEKQGSDAPASQKIDEMYDLIREIEIAMLTTQRTDGRLVSRPMSTQKRDSIADLWFVTDGDTHKLEEIENDSQVNLSYYNNKSREWVSVSGRATLSRDRSEIRRLYQPDWKVWMGDEGGERNGGPDDPRFVLILVDVESVMYMVSNKPKPVVLFEVVKSLVTGGTPELGEERKISARELSGASRGR
jgi:general stress protein 26